MNTSTPAFTQWLDDFFASYYRHRPVNATFIGVHSEDHRLPDYSAAGIADVTNEMATLRQRLSTLSDEPLGVYASIDRDLADGFLKIQEWEYHSNHFLHGNPSLYTSEAIFGILSLFLRPFAPLEERVAHAIARLEALPALLNQGRMNIHAAPSAWTARALQECHGAIIFLTVGIDILLEEEIPDKQYLRRAAAGAAEAFAAYRHWLHVDLSDHLSDAYACGPEALDLLLRHGHFLDQGAEEIERYAAEQLTLSRAALRIGATAFGTTDWHRALARMRDDHPSPDTYQQRFGEIWEAAKDAAIAHDLVTWPDYPVRFVPRPKWARKAAPHLYFLHYRAPAAFDTLPVTDYLITPLEHDASHAEEVALLRETNDSVITLNHVIHHAGIGHHVQNWHAYRARSRIGQIAAVDCASRIALFCGGTMAEGWACYATDLMNEIGFLTPLQTFAQHHMRARMATRALVDVRLHTGKITLDEASEFYQEILGLSATAAETEAVRNSMFPGTALMYLYGTDQIHDLRTELSQRARGHFSLRRFHDRFLSYGSVPVSRIAHAMRQEFADSTDTDELPGGITT